MKLWEKLLVGAAVAGVAGVIVWRSRLLSRLRGLQSPQASLPKSQSPPVLMENEEVWDVESDEQGIPQRITIHRKVVGG